MVDKLLAWFKGNTSDDLRVDSYKTPGDFPMDLKQSFCLDADGATDSGVTSIAHGTLVSYGGTSTVTYSGTSLSMTAGTLWRLEFSDGTIYPLAEGLGATCFSTDGLHSIALTSGNLTALRSGRQDEYHHNVAGGWWEKSGDSVKYPYDVAGFTEYHKPNTWNGAETKQSFKQTQVATFDGVGDYISLNSSITLSGDFKISIYCGHDLPNIRGFLIKQTSSLAYVIDDPVFSMYTVKVGGVYIEFYSVYQSNNRQPGVLEIVRVGSNLTISINGFSETKSTGLLDTEFNLISFSSDSYSGKMFSVTFEDSSSKTIIPLNEGSGLDIHDSQGNIVGTVTSGNLTDFWANKVTPQELLDIDAPYELFTDATTKDVKLLTQDEIEGKLTIDVASVSFTTPNPIDYLKLTTVDGSDWYMDGQWYPSGVYQSHAAGTDIKIGVPEGVELSSVYLWNNYNATDLTFDISQTGWDVTSRVNFYNTGVTGDISQTGWNLTNSVDFIRTGVTGDISQTGWSLTEYANFYGTGITGDVSQTGWNLTGDAGFSDCNNLTTASSATTLFGPSCLNIRFDGCALTVASVDNILQAVDFLGGLSGTLQLQGGTNGIPTSVGLTAKTNLEGKGWTVTVNS